MPRPATHRRIDTEPHWRRIGQFTTAELPPTCRPWLLDDSSLTARLLQQGPDSFRVERLYQGWQVPLLSESRLLGVAPTQRAMVREVGLLLADQTVVFARSIFPASSLTGRLAHLKYLQNRSLGSILFGLPGMRRLPFELARIPGNSDYLPAQLRQSTAAWGRRSRFNIAGNSLLVSEVFLQAFTAWSSPLAVHRSQRGKVCAAIVRPTQ